MSEGASSKRLSPQVAAVVVVLLCVAAFAIALHSAYRAEMHRSLPRDSFARAMMSIGVSISKLAYGAQGYVLYGPVIAELQLNGFNAEKITEAGTIDRALSAASRMDVPRDDPSIVVRDWGDDKGYADYVSIAFALFGLRIASLFWFYFGLLGLSALAYSIRFRADPPSLLVLLILLVAIKLVTDILPNSTVTSVVHDARFLPTISCIAIMHLALSVMRPGNHGWIFLLTAIIQTSILILVIDSRSSAVWQAMFLFAMLMMSGFVVLRASRSVRRMFPHLLVGCLAVGGLAGLGAYKAATYADVYKTDGTLSHVFWHNLYMGLGIHPEATKRFDLLPDDSTSYRHVQEFLRSSPETASKLGIRQEEIVYPLFAGVGWRRYDHAVGAMYRDFVVRHPRYALESYFLYKPAYIADQLLWQVGLRSEFPSWIVVNPVHKPVGSARLSITGGMFLLVIAGIVVVYAAGYTRLPRALVLSSAALLIFAMAPSFAVAPFYYELPAFFVVFVALTYLSIALALMSVTGLMFAREENL